MGLSLIYPDSISAAAVSNINNASLLVRLDYGETSFLFTGDVERRAEHLISGISSLNVDVVKVGHNGSKTSSAPLIIEKTTPDLAIISVGKKNYYGHPSENVLEQWIASGVRGNKDR